MRVRVPPPASSECVESTRFTTLKERLADDAVEQRCTTGSSEAGTDTPAHSFPDGEGGAPTDPWARAEASTGIHILPRQSVDPKVAFFAPPNTHFRNRASAPSAASRALPGFDQLTPDRGRGGLPAVPPVAPARVNRRLPREERRVQARHRQARPSPLIGSGRPPRSGGCRGRTGRMTPAWG